MAVPCAVVTDREGMVGRRRVWDMVTNNRVVMATEELQLQVPLKTRSKSAIDLSLVVDTHNDGRGWKVLP